MEHITDVSQMDVSDAVDIREIKRTIEAILFAAGHPISYDKLADVLNKTPVQVRKIVREYAEEYNSIDSPVPRGVLLLTFDDSCQLCTMEQYGQYIREALGIRRGGNLSASSIEVLAIVAYNEPVTRAYIDTVRGVDSNYSVNTLCEKHLIEPCGRLDAPGRPMLYRTTEDFLRVFGLNSLDELPEIALPMKAKEGEGAEITDAAPAEEIESPAEASAEDADKNA
jgi:segregation and condensation protein B